jgi:hypothetical protein
MAASVVLNKNERFWSGQMISYISNFVKGKTLRIKNAGGETTVNASGSVMFPDVILYGDAAQGLILQGWEVKMPDVSINNTAFRNDAERKARLLGLNSFVLWNFTYCKLYIKDNYGVYQEAKLWDKTNYITDRPTVELRRSEWEELLGEVLIEVNTFLDNGVLIPRNFDFAISEFLMPEIIERNKNSIADHLAECAKTNITIKNYIEVWWDEVQYEYMTSEPNMYTAYAKTIIVDWLNKLVFAHLISRYHNPAGEVKNITNGITPSQARSILASISNQCDFFNIFKDLQFGNLVPDQCWNEIIEFNAFLSDNGLENIDQTTLQSILERTVISTRREIIGQFTTPPRLAELLTKITIHDTTRTCIDPCCGTGTIPKQIIRYKMENGNTVNDAYGTTWAADKFSFPLQVTNISLTTPESINIPCRIIQKNVFALETGSIEEIVNPKNGEHLRIPLPAFDAIVSNLPFIDFNTIQREDAELMELIKEQVKNDTGITLSERNDTYSYIPFSLWKILNNNGRIGLIVSNSWLGTDSGRDFYNAIRWYYKIEGVYISGDGTWFDNAKVVTTLLILQKKDISEPQNETSNFGLIKKSITEWENAEVFNAIVRSINLNHVQEKHSSIISINRITSNEIASILDFGFSLNILFYTPSWILQIKDSICPISEIFEVTRGEKTCQDEIFYIKKTSLVDNEYVINGLKNAKNIKTLIAAPDTDIFFCEKTRDELKTYGSAKTLSYLQSFDGTLNVSLARKGDEWHVFKNIKPVRLFTGMNPYKRIFYGLLEERTFINQRLIGFIGRDENTDIELCHALLNSILGIFFVESIGFGMGEGALDIKKESFNRAYMLNPKLLSPQKINEIKSAFEPLKNRDIKDTLIEIDCEDRINFDNAVLKAYGLEGFYEDIKQTLISIQNTRLSVND